MGNLHRQLTRQFDTAIKHYQLSLNLARDLKDADWMMRILSGLAGTYLDRAQEKNQKTAYAQAQKYFEESLALCLRLRKKATELDLDTAVLYLSLGMVHRELGHLAKAADLLNTIVTVFEAKTQKNNAEQARLCETYVALADCLSGQKQFLSMEIPIQKAWAISQKMPHLKELQMAIQILWAEACKAKEEWKNFKKHLSLAEQIQHKYHIHPTPFAKKRLTALKREKTV